MPFSGRGRGGGIKSLEVKGQSLKGGSYTDCRDNGGLMIGIGGGVLIDFVLDIKAMGSIAGEWPWAVLVILLMAPMAVGLSLVTRKRERIQ